VSPLFFPQKTDVRKWHHKVARLLTIFLLLAAHPVTGQNWKNSPTHTDASFRGLSVVSDSIAWVSGTHGLVGCSTDGGNTWNFHQVKGYEQCDFRSLYAFDAKNAIIANAGAPAFILTTADAGLTWKKVYENKDSAAFFDGIDFWDNKSGILFGAPINGQLLLLRTSDGGHTWHELPLKSRPILEQGEASFAASGTAIRCNGKNRVTIATGGKTSRLLTSDNRGTTWKSLATPIIHGLTTTGIFSFTTVDNNIIIVGGDYNRDTLRKDHVFISKDGGKHWKAPEKPTGGYRECVEMITQKTAIATGPAGTDITYDSGINWQPIILGNENKYHVVRKSKSGKLIILAGASGAITILTNIPKPK